MLSSKQVIGDTAAGSMQTGTDLAPLFVLPLCAPPCSSRHGSLNVTAGAPAMFPAACLRHSFEPAYRPKVQQRPGHHDQGLERVRLDERQVGRRQAQNENAKQLHFMF
jgi:hypothetical protein